MITETMVHNAIEDAKRAIRQNLESNQFAEVLITVNSWFSLKGIEDKLKSGSVLTKEDEKDFNLSYSLCQPIYNPDKRLEDMEVTITDASDELDKARALIKKYVLLPLKLLIISLKQRTRLTLSTTMNLVSKVLLSWN